MSDEFDEAKMTADVEAMQATMDAIHEREESKNYVVHYAVGDTLADALLDHTLETQLRLVAYAMIEPGKASVIAIRESLSYAFTVGYEMRQRNHLMEDCDCKKTSGKIDPENPTHRSPGMNSGGIGQYL